ncbi:hypothetical protein P5634_04610 [Bacillus subtilis]|nr:hypothetical protein P5634_04610 [Bacillus subtilis]WGD92657.1 hypothetical protein P5629_21360 [Bacillus subtilis]
MGALFLHLKPGEYLKKQYKTKKLVEKTSFSLQAEGRPRLPFSFYHIPSTFHHNPPITSHTMI